MFDQQLVLFFHAFGVAHPAWARAVAFLNYADVAALLVLCVVLLARQGSRKKQVDALLVLFAVVAISYLANRILGAIFFRPRPFVTLAYQPFIAIPSGLKSFPSTHATVGAAIAYWCAVRGGQRFAWGAAILAILIGLARIFVGVHYPTDVVAGWVLGVVTSWFTIKYVWKKFAS